MENEFEGTVEDVSEKPNKNGVLTFKIKLGGKVYSGFGKAPCKKGDRVHFEYTQNEQWLNIVKDSLQVINDVEPPFENPTTPYRGNEYAIDLRAMNEAKELKIVKQSCLKCAVEFHKGEAGLTPNKIIETTKVFVSYVMDE